MLKFVKKNILNSKAKIIFFSVNLLLPIVLFSIPEKHIDFGMQWTLVFLLFGYVFYRSIRIIVSLIKQYDILYHSLMLVIFLVASIVSAKMNTNEYLPENIEDITPSLNWYNAGNCPCISKEHDLYGVMVKVIEEPEFTTGSARTIFGVYKNGMKVYEFKLSENYSHSKMTTNNNGFVIWNDSQDEDYLNDKGVISELPKYIHVQAE